MRKRRRERKRRGEENKKKIQKQNQDHVIRCKISHPDATITHRDNVSKR